LIARTADEREALAAERRRLKAEGSVVVITNGCFDLLHSGHIAILEAARAAGDVLIVAINSDRSVHEIKGPERPIFPERERAETLSAMECVDHVIIYDEPTPAVVIDELLPDVLVKGADWGENAIVGRETVEAHGGRVLRVPLLAGRSTTSIIEKIRRP
jgi:rfaE bifunctional protein nucleotidyltransferase chain/domain